MKHLFVPTTALAAILALSIPAAAVMFGDGASTTPVPQAQPAPKVVAMSPDGTPVRVIAMSDGNAKLAILPDVTIPTSADVAPTPVQFKEAAMPAPARPARIRKVAANGAQGAFGSNPTARSIGLGSLY